MSLITLHKTQSKVFKEFFLQRMARFLVIAASRGWGKSYFAATAAQKAIDELSQLHPDVPHKNVFVIAPTYQQVCDIYYPLFAYEFEMEKYALKASKDTGRFEFPNNVSLRLVSYEAVERLRGLGAYFVIGDEPCSWTKGVGLKEAWESIILPCIATRWSPKRALAYGAKNPGRGMLIGTPKGFNHFYDMYNYRENDPNWMSYHFDYTTSPYLDPAEIERIRHNTDPVQFAREYLASFEESGNRVFYCFDRKIHVRNDLHDFYNDSAFKETVHVNIDFNVNIQASSFFAVRGGQAHFLDEMQGHPDTDTLAKAIKSKYIDKGHKVHAYPDPSGNSRKTSATVGRTDFSILREYGINVHAPDAAPSLVDSAQCVNRLLKTAAGDVNFFIHPRCRGLIQSMERTVWSESNPDIAVIDKKEGVEHFSDGVRYGMSYLFPIRSHSKTIHTGFRF